jgi:preprotein translocase subunit SecB
MSETLKNGHDQKGPDQKNEGPLFTAHSIYVKDVSFEAPLSPKIFNEEWKPRIDFDLQMGTQTLSEAEGLYEVLLHITVTAKLGEELKEAEEKTAFLIEIQQAGIFGIKNIPAEPLKEVLGITCPTMLFPFAREAISNLATRGGFPQLILPPINFEAMYAHHLEESQKGKVEGKTN